MKIPLPQIFGMGFLLEVIEISVQSGSNCGFVEQQWNLV